MSLCDFTFIPHKDQMNNDLGRIGVDDISQELKLQEYAKLAKKNPNCVGFNSLGYMKSKIETLTYSKYFNQDDGMYVKKIYNDGLYICGCVKNCGHFLQEVLNNIELMSTFFVHCEVIIAYDHSTDDSLEILKNMSSVLNLKIIYNDNKSHKNVINITNARNCMMDYIRIQNDPKFKFFMMIDMDNVSSSPINMDVFHKYLAADALDKWDTISFNQKQYYDLWALSIDEYLCSCWHFESSGCGGTYIEKCGTYIEKVRNYITDRLKKAAENGNELVECVSAFNGCAIYKKDKFIACYYDSHIEKTMEYITADQITQNEKLGNFKFNISIHGGSYDCDCEHRHFHLMAKHLNSDLKLRISPEVLFSGYKDLAQIELEGKNRKSHMIKEQERLQIEIHKDIFFKKIKTIPPPNGKIAWCARPNRLTCCIIEPRIMAELNGVLNNIANIYGNSNAGLVIYHGTKNEDFVKEIVKGWENVELRNLNVENLKVSEYSNLLTKKSFYETFDSSHILIFQCDSYIFKPVPEIYFTFDYVGSPWPWELGNGCGNGGVSLRNVKTMIEKSTKDGVYIAEDVYFTKQDLKVCDDNTLHREFSVEHIFVPSPVCCHQPYLSMKTPDKKYKDFLNNIMSNKN